MSEDAIDLYEMDLAPVSCIQYVHKTVPLRAKHAC